MEGLQARTLRVTVATDIKQKFPMLIFISIITQEQGTNRLATRTNRLTRMTTMRMTTTTMSMVGAGVYILPMTQTNGFRCQKHADVDDCRTR